MQFNNKHKKFLLPYFIKLLLIIISFIELFTKFLIKIYKTDIKNNAFFIFKLFILTNEIKIISILINMSIIKKIRFVR